MSTQLVTREVADLKLWFEETLPCEVTWEMTKDWHPNAAEWRALGRCPKCDAKQNLVVCTGCVTYIHDKTVVNCTGCGVKAFGWKFFKISKL